MNWLFYSIKIKLAIFNEHLINLLLQILKEMTHHTMLVRSTQNGHKLCLIASFAFLESSSTSEKFLSRQFHVFQGTLLLSSHAIHCTRHPKGLLKSSSANLLTHKAENQNLLISL